ncbi:unnamed protein product [Eruca vesicaria subsp. sativa]|uniref:Uncharacterized protein n=1 Tax=Eruca vesicaria subsp. sativa TaxID=29727 RepID=A0ABC8K741_ERUVS|nr:unnamed protein product [Eruca vesicaria subsp. sativa]
MYDNPFLNLLRLIFVCLILYIILRPLYDCCCLSRSRSHHIRSRNNRSTMVFVSANPAHTASRGLDPAVAKSLPVFIFSAWTHRDPIDCVVCLSQFEEGESGRPPATTLEEQVAIVTIPPESGSSAMPLEEAPVSQMPSSTRMLSRDGRSAPSSFVGALSQSLSSSCGIVMTESDIERRGEEIK